MSEQPDRMDLHEFRASRRRKTDNLLKEEHRDLKRFFALDSAAYRDLTGEGGLDTKTKELLGLVASTVLRCNDCIAYHCDQCVKVGWRKSELLDALNVALVVGGSITIPHIRTVWEVVEQLYGEREAEARGPGQAATLAAAVEGLQGDVETHPSQAHATLGLPPAARTPRRTRAAPPVAAPGPEAKKPEPARVAAKAPAKLAPAASRSPSAPAPRTDAGATPPKRAAPATPSPAPADDKQSGRMRRRNP